MTVTFTVDLEDASDRYAPDGRYVAMTRRILDMCDETGCKATFFTVGRVGGAAPGLIRDIAARGHEIAYHSHAHVSLTREEPARFRRETADDKKRFEDLTGQPVAGFRAPRFSLTPQSLWALDILAEAGFRYSSSIMPTSLSLFGFPDMPRAPFAWPNGIVEFPLPVRPMGKYPLPYLGGIYLYTMPLPLARYFMRKAGRDEVLWTYTHPYDFDSDEKFSRLPGAPLWVSIILWLARRKAAAKIRAILATGTAPPLRDRIPASLMPLKIQ